MAERFAPVLGLGPLATVRDRHKGQPGLPDDHPERLADRVRRLRLGDPVIHEVSRSSRTSTGDVVGLVIGVLWRGVGVSFAG